MTTLTALPSTNPFASRSPVGFGAMNLERLLRAGDRTAAVDLVRHAVDLGVDHIDTAPFYGHGAVDEVLREAIPRDADVLLVTKVGAVLDDDGVLRPAQRPADLRASVEDALRGLGTDRLDVVNLRRLDTPHGIRATGDQVVSPDDQLATLVELRERGVIGAIGVSGVTADGVRRALPAGIVCVQNAYNLLARADEDQVGLCERSGMAWVPFFPLGGAAGRMTSVVDHPVVRAVAGESGLTPAQVGLAWLLGHSAATRLIPGTADLDHLRANVAAAQTILDDDAVARLDALAA
ncbi:aldo/keto reductase [Williamsia serinedens]|uniref:Oxidoreductase n=1 Tax=Williamsia serinedens TaxID=391736 RepID=A0ABT1GZC0_9NOCA|nr:aldo/keto reductase [Williamsia serinedens]MCP2160074.1 putative oxidoreductase [Williamsia serinedens]